MRETYVKSSRRSLRGWWVRAWVFGQCLVASGLLLHLTGWLPDWEHGYAPERHFARETDALRRGELSLARDPGALEHDLAWSEHGVHHVWGLGLPLWRWPWETLASLAGWRPLPDRFPMALFLAVASFGLFRVLTGFPFSARADGPGRAGSTEWGAGRLRTIGVLAVLCACPPLISLLSCRGRVYEEVLVYVYGCGLLFISGLIGLARQLGWRGYWGLCALAGLGGFVRPTLVFYGMATVAVGALVMAAGKREQGSALCGGTAGPAVLPAGEGPLAAEDTGRGPLSLPSVGQRTRRGLAGGLGLGLALFVAGGGLLWVTNLLRFGDGFEFGHRLNVQSGNLLGSVYATRFDHPFQEEPLGRALRELMGALFLTPQFNGGDWYAEGLFPGQSSTVRWREFYFTTYDLSGAVLLGAGWAAGLWAGWRWWRGRRGTGAPALPLSAVLAGWSVVATLPLAGFYLRTPALSSRYLLDFAPAFAAATVVAWWGLMDALGRGWPRAAWLRAVAFGGLIVWLGVEIGRAQSAYGPPRSLTREEVRQRQQARAARPPVQPLPSRYRLGDDLGRLGIPYNGAGWDTESGAVAVAVILFVDRPEFLEVDVIPGPGTTLPPAEAVQVRAKVGLEFLRREAVTRTAEGWRVRFAGPQRPRYQRGIQPVFLAMVPKERLAEPSAPWRLAQVSWRRAAAGEHAESPLEGFQGSSEACSPIETSQ